VGENEDMSLGQTDRLLGLRCDVDFGIGIQRGVPRLLESLKSRDLYATFYVTMGPDGFSRNTSRLNSRSYIGRIRRMQPLRMVQRFGLKYLAQQSLGKAGNVGADHPEVMHRILNEGHELGVHGYDHYWWAENVWSASEELLRLDIERAMECFVTAVGQMPSTWASPNWRCSSKSLEITGAYGFEYGADTRGYSVFNPVLPGQDLVTAQVPITVPCLHEISDAINSSDDDSILDNFAEGLTGRRQVWCIHDYYEGLLKFELFERCLDLALQSGWKVVPIIDYWRLHRNESVPAGEVVRGQVPGGRGEVSVQSRNQADGL
jgi:undecaprenyl phosphate-alpha-L-ara4FN deformylase